MYYIDEDYRLYVQPRPGLTAVELPEMEGKCRAYIEGYRYVPEGRVWIREDGTAFNGAMLSPATDYAALEMAQGAYEEALSRQAEELADTKQALDIMGVKVNG